MSNFNLLLVVVLLMGCGTTPVVGDAGVIVPDAEVIDGTDGAVVVVDGGVEDAGRDGAADAAALDAGGHPDAAMVDAGSDAGREEDAGMADAGVDAGMMDAGPGTPIDIGVSGNGSCLLTDTGEMWCWGYGNSTPVYVADVVELEGVCGIALDGHVICWTGSGPMDYAGTDVSVVGVQVIRNRADGLVRPLTSSSPTWMPSSAIEEMPTQNCAIYSNGGLVCWDNVRVSTIPERFEFQNFWNAVGADVAHDVVDVARRGTFNANDFVSCYTWASAGGSGVAPATSVVCSTERGTTGSPQFARGTEVEIAGGRACSMVPTTGFVPGVGHHPAGVYCTADRPAVLTESGYWPLNPLPADAYMQEYTEVVGTHLALGLNHACVMQDSNIVCWGDNRSGQLGDGTLSSSRVPVMVVW